MADLFVYGSARPHDAQSRAHLSEALRSAYADCSAVLSDGPGHPNIFVCGLSSVHSGLRFVGTANALALAPTRVQLDERSAFLLEPSAATLSALGQRGAEAPIVVVARCAEDRSLLVANDGTGFIPVFFASLPNGDICLSTSLRGLVAMGLPCRLDAAHCLEYLTFLHPLGDATLLTGARTLPPGSILHWSASAGVTIRRRAFFSPCGGYRPESRNGSLSALAVEFESAWSETLQLLAPTLDDSLLSLSGGLDSRAIAAGLHRSGAFHL